jgi:hypothetical protein
MPIGYAQHLASVPRRVMVFAVMSLTLIAASPAMAKEPTGEYAAFNDCPRLQAGVLTCVYSRTTGGEVKIGNTAVPITNPIVLQGGLEENSKNEEIWVNAVDGNTLTKAPQTVPGGLLGIVAPESWPKWLQELFNKFINEGITGVTATTELVGTVHFNLFNLIFAKETGIVLPVRVKLSNPFLGEGCYIGSSKEPILLNLTTGTTSPPTPNKPISGSVGEIEIKNSGNLVISKGMKLVDNAFAAPVVNGCGGLFSFLVNPAVDLKLGLPSAAGHNTAILTGLSELASAEAVRESEK